MQRMGIPIPAVKQALQKEGKDPSIIDMDPEKPYASQIKDKASIKADVPLKDDPEYSKFFKVGCIVLTKMFVEKCDQHIRSHNASHFYL